MLFYINRLPLFRRRFLNFSLFHWWVLLRSLLLLCWFVSLFLLNFFLRGFLFLWVAFLFIHLLVEWIMASDKYSSIQYNTRHYLQSSNVAFCLQHLSTRIFQLIHSFSEISVNSVRSKPPVAELSTFSLFLLSVLHQYLHSRLQLLQGKEKYLSEAV